ncbi:MAG: Holliday junction resolvase RuvX [Acidobacteriota bacterium]
MRALGVDFGERRIGLAMSDPAGRFALPREAIERTTDRRAVYRLVDLVHAERVEILVLGEPLGPAGEPSEASLRVRRFGAKLARATSRPVLYVDETLTTVAASERLADRDADARRDAVAAQIILQEAIDRGLLAEASGRLVDEATS